MKDTMEIFITVMCNMKKYCTSKRNRFIGCDKCPYDELCDNFNDAPRDINISQLTAQIVKLKAREKRTVRASKPRTTKVCSH